MIRTSIQGLVLGFLTGCIWTLMLGLPPEEGMLWGALTGLVIAMLLFVFEQMILRTGLIHSMELNITSLTFFSYIFAAISAVGLLGGLMVAVL